MLEGLDEIDWSAMTHAYGPAADVPGLIRDLTSADGEVREKALHELYGNIWHQGTVYEATSHAVPFLAEVARSPTTPDRHLVVALLGDIARGQGFSDQHADFLADEGRFNEEVAERERGWVLTVGEAVSRECPRLIGAVDEADWRLAAMVVRFVIAACPEEAKTLLPRLRELMESEDDPIARSALALSLILLGEPRSGLLDEVERVVRENWRLGDYEPAIGALREGRDPPSPTPDELLVDLMDEPERNG